MEEYDVLLSEVESFMESRVWKKVVEEALSRALLLSEDNDMINPVTDCVTLCRNQGEIRALKWVTDLPKLFIDELLEKQGSKRKNKGEEGE